MMKFALILSVIVAITICYACETYNYGDRFNVGDHRQPPVDTLKFTAEEKALITEGDSAVRMQLMFLNEQPDSIILRNRSREIRLTEPELELLTDRMYSTVRNPQNAGVGIAAPQIGINRRIIWVRRYDKVGKPWEVFHNIYITDMSDTVKARNDGCLSIPGVSGQSLRAIWVEVEYELPDGNRQTERITQEYTAHIFQHEIDHLDGIVWLDRRPTTKLVIIDSHPNEYDGLIMPDID